MKTLTPQLPTFLGAFSAMLIAFLSLVNGTSPGTCLMKAFSAFLVFAGLGLILRHALTIEDDENGASDSNNSSGLNNGMGSLDMIVPGTSVADLLADHHAADNAHSARAEAQTV